MDTIKEKFNEIEERFPTTVDGCLEDVDTELEIVGRLRHLMSIKHLSQRRLAGLLKLDPSNLSKVMTGKLPFTEGLVNRIVADLGVSKTWLKTGGGLPFEKESLTKDILLPEDRKLILAGTGVPVYDIDVTAGCRSLEQIFSETRPVGMMNIPELPSESQVVKVRGDSMSPRISNGGYVAIRRIRDPRNIFWGQMYVVQLDEYRMVKYVRRHTDPSMVVLHSANPAYDDMDIARNEIRALYIVEAVLNYEVY